MSLAGMLFALAIASEMPSSGFLGTGGWRTEGRLAASGRWSAPGRRAAEGRCADAGPCSASGQKASGDCEAARRGKLDEALGRRSAAGRAPSAECPEPAGRRRVGAWRGVGFRLLRESIVTTPLRDRMVQVYCETRGHGSLEERLGSNRGRTRDGVGRRGTSIAYRSPSWSTSTASKGRGCMTRVAHTSITASRSAWDEGRGRMTRVAHRSLVPRLRLRGESFGPPDSATEHRHDVEGSPSFCSGVREK